MPRPMRRGNRWGVLAACSLLLLVAAVPVEATLQPRVPRGADVLASVPGHVTAHSATFDLFQGRAVYERSDADGQSVGRYWLDVTSGQQRSLGSPWGTMRLGGDHVVGLVEGSIIVQDLHSLNRRTMTNDSSRPVGIPDVWGGFVAWTNATGGGTSELCLTPLGGGNTTVLALPPATRRNVALTDDWVTWLESEGPHEWLAFAPRSGGQILRLPLDARLLDGPLLSPTFVAWTTQRLGASGLVDQTTLVPLAALTAQLAAEVPAENGTAQPSQNGSGAPPLLPSSPDVPSAALTLLLTTHTLVGSVRALALWQDTLLVSGDLTNPIGDRWQDLALVRAPHLRPRVVVSGVFGGCCASFSAGMVLWVSDDPAAGEPTTLVAMRDPLRAENGRLMILAAAMTGAVILASVGVVLWHSPVGGATLRRHSWPLQHQLRRIWWALMGRHR